MSHRSISPTTDFFYSPGIAWGFAGSEQTQSREAGEGLQEEGREAVIPPLLQFERYSALVFVVRTVAELEVHFGLS